MYVFYCPVRCYALKKIKIANYVNVFYLYTLNEEQCASSQWPCSSEPILWKRCYALLNVTCSLWIVCLLVKPQLFHLHKHHYKEWKLHFDNWSSPINQEGVIRCESNCIWNTKLWVFMDTRPGCFSWAVITNCPSTALWQRDPLRIMRQSFLKLFTS